MGVGGRDFGEQKGLASGWMGVEGRDFEEREWFKKWLNGCGRKGF